MEIKRTGNTTALSFFSRTILCEERTTDHASRDSCEANAMIYRPFGFEANETYETKNKELKEYRM